MKRRLLFACASGAGLYSFAQSSSLFQTGSCETRGESKLTDFGLPSAHPVLFRNNYVISYNNRTRLPDWVLEHLTKAAVAKDNGNTDVGVRDKSQFKADTAIPQPFRATPKDYLKSGYDRGHLVPAANVRSMGQQAMDDTFLLSNIAPQDPNFNRGYWNGIEQFVRHLTKSYDDVFVISGPLFLPKWEPAAGDGKGRWIVEYHMIGDPPSVAVPTHFFKAVLAVRSSSSPSSPSSSSSSSSTALTVSGSHQQQPTQLMAAFVLPNESIPMGQPLVSFLVPVEELERQAGLLLFPKVDRRQVAQLCSVSECRLPPWMLAQREKDKDKEWGQGHKVLPYSRKASSSSDQ